MNFVMANDEVVSVKRPRAAARFALRPAIV